jgi:hypothetical protein
MSSSPITIDAKDNVRVIPGGTGTDAGTDRRALACVHGGDTPDGSDEADE